MTPVEGGAADSVLALWRTDSRACAVEVLAEVYTPNAQDSLDLAVHDRTRCRTIHEELLATLTWAGDATSRATRIQLIELLAALGVPYRTWVAVLNRFVTAMLDRLGSTAGDRLSVSALLAAAFDDVQLARRAYETREPRPAEEPRFARPASPWSHPAEEAPLTADVVAQLQRTIGDLSGDWLGQGVRMTLEVEAPTCAIALSPYELRGALLNLADNAIAAMPAGGAIRVVFERVRIERGHRLLIPGEYASIALVDQGLGMSAETLGRAFDPFYSSHPGRRGLGLTAVRASVRSSAGEIELASAPRLGTTATLLIPVVATVESTATQPAVLVVEDDPAVRSLMAQYLTGRGFRVLLAKDGCEAQQVAAAAGHAIDLIVADMTLPDSNGSTVAKQLKVDSPGARILLLSGHPREAFPRVQLAGAEFLQKPFSLGLLGAQVDRLARAPKLGDKAGSSAAKLEARSRPEPGAWR